MEDAKAIRRLTTELKALFENHSKRVLTETEEQRMENFKMQPMSFPGTLRKSGSSLTLTIPHEVVHTLGASAGEVVQATIQRTHPTAVTRHKR